MPSTLLNQVADIGEMLAEHPTEVTSRPFSERVNRITVACARVFALVKHEPWSDDFKADVSLTISTVDCLVSMGCADADEQFRNFNQARFAIRDLLMRWEEVPLASAGLAAGQVEIAGGGKADAAAEPRKLAEVRVTLDKESMVILKVLADSDTFLTQIEIATRTDETDDELGKNLDRGTVGKRLRELKKNGYVSQPKGTRKGWIITAKGKKIIPPKPPLNPH